MMELFGLFIVIGLLVTWILPWVNLGRIRSTRKEGDHLVLEPVLKSATLLEVLSSLPTLKGAFLMWMRACQTWIMWSSSLQIG